MKALSTKTDGLSQSGIRAITRLVNEVDGINLGQGICDMPTPDPIKVAARNAIDSDKSIYTPYEGIGDLQTAIFNKVVSYNNIPCSSPGEIMVSAGSTGAFVTTVFTLLNPGDEIILFEPFYGYHRGILDLTGAVTVPVPLTPGSWSPDFERIEAAISPKTKAIVVNTPGNPCGKVWTSEELTTLLDLLTKYDLYAITDEIYEYMVYDGRQHVSLASLPGAYERTVTISGFSKTYNMTGWRLGYAVACPEIISRMGLLNDLFYICAPSPLQYGVVAAFDMSDSYFDELLREYDRKRALLCETLAETGFDVTPPEGSYYVFTRFDALADQYSGFEDDRAACETLIRQTGVATIPGRSFFTDPSDGARFLRFCYAKKFPLLQQACRQMQERIPAMDRR